MNFGYYGPPLVPFSGNGTGIDPDQQADRVESAYPPIDSESTIDQSMVNPYMYAGPPENNRFLDSPPELPQAYLSMMPLALPIRKPKHQEARDQLQGGYNQQEYVEPPQELSGSVKPSSRRLSISTVSSVKPSPLRLSVLTPGGSSTPAKPPVKRPYNGAHGSAPSPDYEIPEVLAEKLNVTFPELAAFLPKTCTLNWFFVNRLVNNGVDQGLHAKTEQYYRGVSTDGPKDMPNSIGGSYRVTMRAGRAPGEANNKWMRKNHPIPADWDYMNISMKGFVPSAKVHNYMNRQGPEPIPFRDLVKGVIRFPEGKNAADLTRAVQYAVDQHKKDPTGKEYMYPTHWGEIMDIIGYTKVDIEQSDREAFRRHREFFNTKSHSFGNLKCLDRSEKPVKILPPSKITGTSGKGKAQPNGGGANFNGQILNSKGRVLTGAYIPPTSSTYVSPYVSSKENASPDTTDCGFKPNFPNLPMGTTPSESLKRKLGMVDDNEAYPNKR